MSMHNRSEVEKRVAQEIKNHADFIYLTNQRLQDLETQIKGLYLALSECRASCLSEINSHAINFDNLEKECSVFAKNLQKSMDDSLYVLKKLQIDIENQIDSFKESYVSKHVYAEEMSNAMVSCTRSAYLISRLESALPSEANKLKVYIDQEINKLRDYVDNLPDEVEPLKSEIQHCKDVTQINVNGYVRELDILKRKILVGEKKFENIYTLIERIQKKMGD